MITHLLVDLDDTLLQNSMEIFAPPYYKALSTYLAEQVSPQVMLPKLLEGTEAMMKNSDPTTTLEHAFDLVFYPGIGLSKEKIRPCLEEFYDTIFPTLKKYTNEIPAAKVMISEALQLGLKIIVATNPLFPLKAIRHRLEWAGLPPKDIPYTLVACYETFHFTKPNPAYYKEILDKVNITSEECVMVGNDLEMDIQPAKSIGIKCFRIENDSTASNRKNGYTSGMQDQVIPWIKSLNL
jgi:HAD superfamily hydrolase (TIGR01549 family)